MKRKILIGLSLIALGCVPFLRAANYGLINLDDYLYLTTHEWVINWQGWETIRHAFTDVSESIWMPLAWLSFALDYALYGDWYGGFHLTAIAVHFVNAALVWTLLTLLFAAADEAAYRTPQFFMPWLTLIGALIWAVHPLRCESVIFLASRKDVLSFFFELLALICWVKGARTTWKWTAASCLFFVLGSCAKPSVMTFPLLCFLIDFCVLREVCLLRYIAPVAYMLFLGAFAAWQQQQGGVVLDIFNQPLWGRLLGACAAFGVYLRNFVWPQWLALQCIKIWPIWPRFWLPGLLLSAAWGWFLLRQAFRFWDNRAQLIAADKIQDLPVKLTNREPVDFVLLGAAWFAIAVAPMLGIVSFGYHAFADRFTYIPAVGLSILLIVALRGAAARFGHVKVLILGGMVVLALAGATGRQTGFWRDDQTLFTHTLEVDGEQNLAAHGILAHYYFEITHDLQKCVEEFEKATVGGDLTHVYRSYEFYIYALCELGRQDEVPEKLRLFEEAMVRCFGPEHARKIFSFDADICVEENFCRAIYYTSKIVWLSMEPDGLEAAEELLNHFAGSSLETDTSWLYAQWKFYANKGDAEKARHFEDLLRNNNSRYYSRFRYLKNQPR